MSQPNKTKTKTKNIFDMNKSKGTTNTKLTSQKTNTMNNSTKNSLPEASTEWKPTEADEKEREQLLPYWKSVQYEYETYGYRKVGILN